MAEPHHGQIVLVGSLNAGGWWGAVCSVEPTGGLWSVQRLPDGAVLPVTREQMTLTNKDAWGAPDA